MRSVEYLTSMGVDVKSSLELFGDINTYNDTLGEFVVSATEKLARLEAYKNSKDIANYTIYVHSLKSDSRYFGFTSLGDIAYEHEMKGKSGDVLYIQQNFGQLQDAVKSALAIANEYLNGSDSAPAKAAPTAKAVTVTGEVYVQPAILVVDDSSIIRNFVKRIFSDKYYVGDAKNGQEAINIIAANADNDQIKAILLDLNMPGVDGFAVLEYMKSNLLFQKIPVSIISGDSTKDTIDRAFTYPIVDMLGKPFSEDNVKNILEKTLMYKELS